MLFAISVISVYCGYTSEPSARLLEGECKSRRKAQDSLNTQRPLMRADGCELFTVLTRIQTASVAAAR